MFRLQRKKGGIRKSKRNRDIDPDEIFIDSSNLPNFDTYQFEGRIEKSISRRTIFFLGAVFVVFFLIFAGRIWNLQLTKGESYFSKSEDNRLNHSLVFAKRGLIYDRNNIELAWNLENTESNSFALRKYISLDGFAHLLGYVKYPSKDKNGFYFSEFLDGKDGVEKAYNTTLAGKNGKRIVEVNALSEIQSENIVEKARDGENLILSIDAGIQSELYKNMKALAERVGFTGGAAVIMDVTTGELLAMTSYPEYNPQILTDGTDKSKINRYLTGNENAFLNRATDGLYTPGSTVKPFMAYAALAEKTIDQYKNIYSSGAISIPNPYDPSKPTIFKDWKAHGYTDMRRALAVSSDVYFYAIGGGYDDQLGLGIDRIDEYMEKFGFADPVLYVASSSEEVLLSGPTGIIPTPEWKALKFNGEKWLIGNTYHTSIGQYGFQISPLHLLRAVSAIANGGKLVSPKIIKQENRQFPKDTIDLKLDQSNLKVIQEGMHDGVIKDYGTGKGLYSENYSVAVKTGTAELGAYKQFVNSWVSGFFPYENPRYAFVVLMEKGPVTNSTGGLYVMRQVMDWMVTNRPEYLK
jgi:penicillin-binding protein 2